MTNRFKLIVNIKTDSYGFRVYGYYIGYTTKSVLALAAGFPDNWEFKVVED